MRGWLVGWVLIAGAGQAGEADGVGRVSEGRPAVVELETLRRILAERDATIARLQRRLEVLEAEHDGRRAEELGLVKAVRAADLPEKQQRRLALTILREAERNGLDPLWIVAVIRNESSFNPYAVSRAGAMGLMQVMPATGRWLMERRGQKLGRAANLFDAELNVELGTFYLAELLARFGTMERALLTYNMGPKAGRRILSQHSRRARFMAGYPTRVMREFHRLKAEQQAEASHRLAETASTPTS